MRQAMGVLIAAALAVLAVYLFLQARNQLGVPVLFPLLLATAAALLFGVSADRLSLRASPLIDRAKTSSLSWRSLVFCGLAAVTALLALLAYRLKLPQELTVPIWAAAQLSLVLGFLPSPASFLGKRVPLGELVVVGAIFVAAGWLRIYDNTSIPLDLHGDMASFGLEARKILAGQMPDFFGVGWAAIPVIGYFPTAISLAVFGDSLFGLNMEPAMMGLASLGATYLISRELFGARSAVFAAALLTISYTHIHFSRVASYLDPVPFILFAFWCLLRGLRTGRLGYFAVGGLLTAYSLLMYYSGRILVLLVLLFLVHVLVADPRGIWARSKGLLLWGLVTLMVLAPTISYWVTHSGDFNQRTSQVLLTNSATWEHTANKYRLPPKDVAGIMLEQVKCAGLTFWVYNDASTQFGYERPMVDPLLGVLLILGLGFSLLRVNSAGHFFLASGFLAYVGATAVTGDPPSWIRIIGVLPFVALLGGQALEHLIERVAPSPHKKLALLASAGVLLLVAVFGVRNWQEYVVWTKTHASARIYIARFLATQEQPDLRVGLVGDPFSYRDREFAFLLPHLRGIDISQAELARANGRLAPELVSGPTIVIFTLNHRDLVSLVQASQPGGQVLLHRAGNGDPSFYSYSIGIGETPG